MHDHDFENRKRLLPIYVEGLFYPVWLSPEDLSREEHVNLEAAFITRTSYPAVILKHSYSEDEWWYCGYVGVSHVHPWHGRDHGEIAEVHSEFGELTFSGIPEYSTTSPDLAEYQIDRSYWYFGFTAAKYGMLGIRASLSLEAVKEECKKLAERLFEVYQEHQRLHLATAKRRRRL